MTVIRQFVSKTASMQAIVDQFYKHENESTWEKAYNTLHNNSEEQTQKLGLSTNVANKEANRQKNRYCNVVPFDDNRIVLASSRYINASPMHSDLTGRDYIFAQGPLESTSADFWQMVYEQETNIIVMLTDCVEWSVMKCHQYFPVKGEETKRFDTYTLELINEEENEWYTIRKFKLTPKKESVAEPRTIHHFQYTNWPDFGVPEDSSNFEKFVSDVRDLDEVLNTEKPIVVHCSAGIGRSGTFVVADIFLTALRSGNTNNLPMIDDLVLQMRRYRMYLVQTSGQLRFCWQAIVNWIRQEKSDDTTRNDEKYCNSTCSTESNGNFDKEETVSSVLCSPGKRASTDEDAINLQKRRQTVENMKKRQKRFEERKNRQDFWLKQIPYIVGFSALLGVVPLLIYRYVGGNEPPDNIS